MKRMISAFLALAIVFSISFAYADTMFCPYCGTKVDTSFSFCPACGKSIQNVITGTKSGEEAGPKSEEETVYYDYYTTNLPGFRHTLPELIAVADSLYNEGVFNRDHKIEAKAYTPSTFPIKMTVDWTKGDAITSLNLPNVRKRYYDNGQYVYESRFDPAQGRYLKEDEEFPKTSHIRIRYEYVPVQPGVDRILNSIVILLDREQGVSQIYFSAFCPHMYDIIYMVMLSSNASDRIVDYTLWTDGRFLLGVTP